MKKLLYLTLLLSFLGCKDFLNVEPVEQISINTQLSTKNGALVALNGAYYKTRTTLLTDSFFAYADLLGGNITFTPSTSNGTISIPPFVNQIYNFADEKSDSDLASFYSGSYEIINNLNLILENLDQIADATSGEKNQIKAECLALRAFIHFNLYKIYAQNHTFTADSNHLGIVYNTRPLKVGIDYPARETAFRSLELLTNDIESAIPLYTSGKAIPAGFEYQFLNVNAAKSLAAEIALWKNDWQKAIKWSDEVINNPGKTLTPTAELSTNWAQSEKIWDLPRTDENDNMLGSLYNFTSNSQYSKYAVSGDYTQLLETNDARKNILETKTIRSKLYTFTTKYKNISGLIYRLTELYFIRGEAYLKSGKNDLAKADINKIRARAGLQPLEILTIDDLLLEKRKEFTHENKYFWDLMRNQKNVLRNLGCISTQCNLAYPNNKFVVPIPQQSIEINNNMIQNPGY
ncbi:RagB/SusD family nutrient uptake outer membrane protein [Chryseobacterium sp. MP_3.2]|uniref:RagB/SusD family nutrient uptake outer membrane protein n=1 Tax=Chryseobacterium sp. MP_3.2 TaxID=3071712 RepID=UPI002DF7F94A|nr:hypothetical protein [Chryseobacterium sp. MP_3.2]